MDQCTIEAVFFDLGDTLVDGAGQWIAGAPAVLIKLRQRNVRLGIISNTSDLTREQILQELPGDFDLAWFDANLVIFSSEIGVEKPGLEIFACAVLRAGKDAASALFCTEDLSHALAAQRVGLRVARLQRPPSSDLEQLIPALDIAGLLA